MILPFYPTLKPAQQSSTKWVSVESRELDNERVQSGREATAQQIHNSNNFFNSPTPLRAYRCIDREQLYVRALPDHNEAHEMTRFEISHIATIDALGRNWELYTQSERAHNFFLHSALFTTFVKHKFYQKLEERASLPMKNWLRPWIISIFIVVIINLPASHFYLWEHTEKRKNRKCEFHCCFWCNLRAVDRSHWVSISSAQEDEVVNRGREKQKKKRRQKKNLGST